MALVNYLCVESFAYNERLLADLLGLVSDAGIKFDH